MSLDRATLFIALGTLPGAVWFIWLYMFDGWWRQWFGRSLMAIAVGVLIACIGAICVRLYGFDWWLRPWIGVTVWSLTLFGMWTRAVVLYLAKRDDKRPAGSGR